MIRCYYTQETLDTVAKAGRQRAIGCGCIVYGWAALILIGITIYDPAIWVRLPDALVLWCCTGFYCGLFYLMHWSLCYNERTTLEHAGDKITLDDDKILLVRVDGTQITLPRKGLKIHSRDYHVYRIRSSQYDFSPEIVLTPAMENAKELIETIQPGGWWTMD